MIAKPSKNPAKCVAQDATAKSQNEQLVKQVSRLVKKAGLDYDGWRYLARRVRERCDLKPQKKPMKLPRILNADDFRKFFKAVDEGGDAQHILMMRVLFSTGCRVAELCSIEVADVDVEQMTIRINRGKGNKDRVVLFDKKLAIALRTHIDAHSSNRYLFQSKRHSRFSTRRIEQIVEEYGRRAGVAITPHVLRHQLITHLTRNSGMADAEIQVLSGHSTRKALEIYQHVSVDGKLGRKYQAAMDGIDV